MTALIKHGDIDDLAVLAPGLGDALGDDTVPFRVLENMRTVSDEPTRIEFQRSGEARGIAVKSILLERGFEGFLPNFFGADNEIYFLAWGWDFSGQSPVLRPEAGVAASDLVNKLAPGERVEFMGEGIAAFPAREVVGGINVRIQIWESDQGVREMGETLKKVAASVKSSKLTNLLALLAVTGGVTTATITLIKDAAVELAGVIGTILKANGNDYVDLFEGHWPVSAAWTPGEEDYRGHACHLDVRRIS